MSYNRAIDAKTFLGKLGVNIHTAYTDGKYDDFNALIEKLQYLGINNVRDHIPNTTLGGFGYLHYAPIARAGLKYYFVTTGADTNIADTIGRLDNFNAENPGSLIGIEGPNEVNNWPISYGSISGDAAALSYQADLYSALKSNLSLKYIEFANLVSWPTLVGTADQWNAHIYPWGGSQPNEAILGAIAEKTDLVGNIPFIVTEAGYNSNPNTSGVSESAQAKLELNMIFDAIGSGIDRIYLYELLDAYPDPTKLGYEWGLFNYDGTPKLIAKALHNLAEVLQSSDSTVSLDRVAPAPIVLDSSSSIGHMRIDKSTSIYDLVLWNEPTIWDYRSKMDVTPEKETKSVSFSDLVDVRLYDVLSGNQPFAFYNAVSQINVDLTDRPIIVEVVARAQPNHVTDNAIAIPQALNQPLSINQIQNYGNSNLPEAVRNPLALTSGVKSDLTFASFRFFDTKTGDHFYTNSVAEKASVVAGIPNYKYEGVGWGVPQKNADTIDVFRFFDTQTGNHFLTSDANERDVIGQTLAHYKYEGVAFQAYADQWHENSVTLDRFFNTKTGLHHFSANQDETAGILAGSAGPDWVYEGHGLTVVADHGDLLNA